jgi:hypothetical protein
MAFHALGHAFSHDMGFTFPGMVPAQPILLEDATHDLITGYSLDPAPPGRRQRRFAVNDTNRDLAALVLRRR